jgi:HdeA/HdeB family
MLAPEDQKKLRGNVMKSVVVPGLLILACLFQEAHAQHKALPPVDFSAMTCDQFWTKTAPDDRGPFLFWLSGYFAHKNNSPVLDPVSFTEKTKALSDYCAKQPNDAILAAAEKTFAN